MIEVIPALMPKSLEDIKDFAEQYRGIDTVETIQLDLMDGEFVPEKTWPFNSKDQYGDFKEIKNSGIPGWEFISFELDLMISDPLRDIDKYMSMGPSRIILHVNSLDTEELVDYIESNPEIEEFVQLGIAFGTTDDVSKYSKLIKLVDFVQCMGIAKVGYQGQAYDSRVLEQVKKVQEIDPSITISIDGGVSDKTSTELKALGVNRLVSGSFLINSEDKASSVEELRS